MLTIFCAAKEIKLRGPVERCDIYQTFARDLSGEKDCFLEGEEKVSNGRQGGWRDRFYYIPPWPAVSPAVENSFMALFPRDRKPDTINPGPPGFDDIMADNWSFRYLLSTRKEEREKIKMVTEAAGW